MILLTETVLKYHSQYRTIHLIDVSAFKKAEKVSINQLRGCQHNPESIYLTHPCTHINVSIVPHFRPLAKEDS